MAEVQKKRHWFSLAFAVAQPGATTYMGIFASSEGKNLTIPAMMQARHANGVPKESCLINVSYLGHMTMDEMNPPPPVAPIQVAVTKEYLDGFVLGTNHNPNSDGDPPANPYIAGRKYGDAMPQEGVDWADGFAKGVAHNRIDPE